MSAVEIVDVDQDPGEAARRLRHRLLRIGAPLLGVLAIAAAVIAVGAYSFVSNRDDALALSQDLIRALDERVTSEVAAFLQPAADAVATVAAVVPAGGLDEEGVALIERGALDLLADRPQLAAIFAGDGRGDFVMVQRSPQGGLDTKQIRHTADGRTVSWTRRDATGAVTATESDPGDSYDPRSRGWFRGALATDGRFWSDIYVFFTTGRLGLSVARRAVLPAAPEVVVGGDIELHVLGDFLRTLKIGSRGEAFIVDADGRLVASPRLAAVAPPDSAAPTVPRVEDLGDSLLTQVYDRVRVVGEGRAIETIDGQRYIIAASSLAAATGQDWRLLLVVPEDDFVGFVAANSRRALYLSGGIMVLALGLAGLLAWQSLATERVSRELARRQRLLDRQGRMLTEVAAYAPQADRGDDAALQRLAATLAEVTGARRISIWQLDAGRGELRCVEGFDRVDRSHLFGAEIRRSECPALFTALDAGEELDVADTPNDPRTAELASIYLGPLGCRGLRSYPVRFDGRVVGAVWLEDLPDEADADRIDAGSLARLLAFISSRRLAAASPQTGGQAVPAETVAIAAGGGAPDVAASALRSASISDLRRRAGLRQLRLRGLEEKDVGAQLFPDCSVLVLRFRDDVALAQHDEAGAGGRIARIVGAFQAEADRLGVRYVKILNDQIIAVEGFDQPVPEGARILAEIALAMQEICSRSFTQRAEFAFGLDSGTVMGSAVGFGEEAYNIWGEAVRIGTRLALTADRGSILASEASYECLRARYLFRRRGAFYLEQVGEMTTYLLRGRL